MADYDVYLADVVNKIRPLKCTYLHFMQLKSILGCIASQPKAKKKLVDSFGNFRHPPAK